MSQAIVNELSVVKSPFKRRTFLILGILAYVGCFQWMYVHYLYPEFDYFGYDYNQPGAGYQIFAWVLSVLPSFWMPLELKRPSQLAYWILYITVIIPSMFVPLYAELNPPSEIVVLIFVLFVGFAIAGIGYLFPLHQFEQVRIPGRLFWIGFGTLATALTLWMVAVFHSSLQILSFEYVYDLRHLVNDMAEGTRVNYSIMWLSGAINPSLMGCGLYYKRGWLFAIGALGQILVYSVIGSKSSILSIAFMLGLYLLLKVGHTAFALKLVFSVLALISVLSFSYYLSGGSPNLIHLFVLGVVLQRTLSIGGLVTAQYYDFFQRNPLTYLSHVHGVNWFVHYPYNHPIGEEIGLAYAGTTDLDATAHFWATDGIEAFGLPGILFVSVLCAFVFWFLDSAAKEHDPRLTALLISFAALNLANISIFTSLLSGGLGLLVIIIYLLPRDDSAVFVKTAGLSVAGRSVS